MNSSQTLQIEAQTEKLSLDELLWLIERLTHRVQKIKATSAVTVSGITRDVFSKKGVLYDYTIY